MKTIEEIREEFVVSVCNWLSSLNYTRATNVKLDDVRKLVDDNFSIEVGGEVIIPCNDYEQESKHYGHHHCTTCHGTGKLSRPKTVRDCLEGR